MDHSQLRVYNTLTSLWEKLHTPTIFKKSGEISAAGATILWPDHSPLVQHLQGYEIIIKPDTTTPVGCEVTLIDDNGAFTTVAALPVAATNQHYGRSVNYPGNGHVLVGTLRINLSDSGISGGSIRINTWGYEE